MEKKVKNYDLVINLTNEKITIYKKDCGIVIDECSAFAVNNDDIISGSNMLFGKNAINEVETNKNVQKLQYINHGELYDVESAYSVVNEMLKKVEKDYTKKKFNVVFLVSNNLASGEYQKYVKLGKYLNFNSIQLIPKIVAYKTLLQSEKSFGNYILFDCDHIEYAGIENNNIVYGNNFAQDHKDLSKRIKFDLKSFENNTIMYEKIKENGFCIVGDCKDNKKYAEYISKDIKLPVSTVFATDNDAISCIGKFLDNPIMIRNLSLKKEDII